MTVLCNITEIEEGTSKGFEIEGKKVFAVKKDDQLHVYHNVCPHLGVNLEWQEDQFLEPDGSLIICSTHGALFNIHDGLCVAGPCNGASLKAVDFDLTENGDVTVTL